MLECYSADFYSFQRHVQVLNVLLETFLLVSDVFRMYMYAYVNMCCGSILFWIEIFFNQLDFLFEIAKMNMKQKLKIKLVKKIEPQYYTTTLYIQTVKRS